MANPSEFKFMENPHSSTLAVFGFVFPLLFLQFAENFKFLIASSIDCSVGGSSINDGPISPDGTGRLATTVMVGERSERRAGGPTLKA